MSKVFKANPRNVYYKGCCSHVGTSTAVDVYLIQFLPEDAFSQLQLIVHTPYTDVILFLIFEIIHWPDLQQWSKLYGL